MSIQAIQAQTAEHQITSLLVAMSVKVDEAVNRAISALLDSRGHNISGLMENAVVIQEMEVLIDQAVFTALERGDLLPSEVRYVTAMINISKDLARLGKLAANLGRKVGHVGEHREHEDFSSLQPLAIAASHLCRQTLRSMMRLDSVLARNAAEGGTAVDAYRNYVFRDLCKKEPQASDEQNMHLIFASRCLEQIADHAAHLAGNLVTFLASRPQTEKEECLAC
jgi:phosphate transport system protein